MKKNQIILTAIGIIIVIAVILVLISGFNLTNDSDEKNVSATAPDPVSIYEPTPESTPAPHGYLMNLINVSESTVWMYPPNSTIEELISFGYKKIEVTDQTFEKYPFIKEILEPKYMTTKSLTGDEERIFFENFYGVTFRYKGHNYIIDAFKN